MSENVRVLEGKRPAWVKQVMDAVGPAECRAFVACWITAEGDIDWWASEIDAELDRMAMVQNLIDAAADMATE